jgi:uncharacterized Zn finger protein
MDEIIKPRIDLKQQETVKCTECGSKYFKEVTMIKKVPKLLAGNHEDVIVPFPTYMCNSCGFVNEEFKLFID